MPSSIAPSPSESGVLDWGFQPGVPSGALASAQRAMVSICSSVSQRASVNVLQLPSFFTPQGGMVRAVVAALIAWAWSRASA
jgi:hypothetical protein